MSMRSWLLVGLCGALIVLSIYPLWDVWVVNAAGVMVNRAVTSGSNVPGDAATDSSLVSDATLSGTAVVAQDPTARLNLQRAMQLMESAASRGPYTTERLTPIWRTYGAAARLVPSAHAYELLLRSRDAGRVDRIGELWLGEVASATGNLDQAAEAYRRIDVSNLLIHRAETALAAGDRDSAVSRFSLAYESLKAAIARTTAEELLLDRTGNEPSVSSRLMQQPAERVISLYRIGRGLLNAGKPSQAIPVLEEAMRTAEAGSPGPVAEQSLRLSLAMALVRTLPTPSTAAPKITYYAMDAAEYEHVKTLARIRILVSRATSSNLTATVCVQAGRIMLLAEDNETAVAYLKKALALNPLLPESYLALGRYYESHGMPINARELYETGASLVPADPGLSAAYAIASYRTMPANLALPVLLRAAEMKNVNEPFVFAFLGDCYVSLGKVGHAQAAYQAGLQLFPGYPALVHRLATLSISHNLMP